MSQRWWKGDTGTVSEPLETCVLSFDGKSCFSNVERESMTESETSIVLKLQFDIYIQKRIFLFKLQMPGK